ncbi:MAG: hypothetical protein ACXVNO_03060 [Bacteroidia bacterium]
MKQFLFFLVPMLIAVCSWGQDKPEGKSLSLPDKCFISLKKKASSIDRRLDRQTVKYLSCFERSERKLKRKLLQQDSSLAGKLFEGVEKKYAELKNPANNVKKDYSIYSGHLDSLVTSLNFIKENNLSDNPALQKTVDQYHLLQLQFDQTEEVKKFLTERQEILKGALEKFGMVGELKHFSKKAYYYFAQIKEYRQAFEDPNRIEQKLLEGMLKIPLFRDYFKTNSQLGSLFSLPGNNATPQALIAGLQTRASINQNLIDRFGNGSVVNRVLQQNIQSAQVQLNQLKNSLKSYGSGSYGNSSAEPQLPQGVKPNNQRTRSFFKRLEYGANIQSQKARSYFPVTSDLGLSIGYKMNDKNIIGLGFSYKLGWGSNWDHIKISHQGVGFRSFMDLKIKGSFFITGGYEENYKAEIQSIQQLKDYSTWQRSGLVGMSKRYKVSQKLKGEIKLLWDFLSYSQIPNTQPIIFRIGYSLN